MPEWGSSERGRPATWRRKSGLETPLVGRFSREGRRLSFAPPQWYERLVGFCIVGAPFLAMLGLFFGWIEPVWMLSVGALVGGAGIWGALSNEWLLCNLKDRTYARFGGLASGKKFVGGPLTELDALVLVSEVYPVSAGVGQTVVYRLVLHWKGRKQPLLVVEREVARLSPGAPLQQKAGPILQRGIRYAQALGVRYFDNAYYHSAGPVPVV